MVFGETAVSPPGNESQLVLGRRELLPGKHPSCSVGVSRSKPVPLGLAGGAGSGEGAANPRGVPAHGQLPAGHGRLGAGHPPGHLGPAGRGGQLQGARMLTL